MTDWAKLLNEEADAVLDPAFDVTETSSVPDSSSVTLKSGAKKIDAAFLYADLAKTSYISSVCPWSTTAKIIKCYLNFSTRLIRAYSGEIRSFDGDRVMGVFAGDMKNTHAANCAREIDWCVYNILAPKAKAKFKSVSDADIKFNHCVGVASGTVRAVRAGIRNNNDLIWIGEAPSLAAKLSDLRRAPSEVMISASVYNGMLKSAKIVDGENIWSEDSFTFAGNLTKFYKTVKVKHP